MTPAVGWAAPDEGVISTPPAKQQTSTTASAPTADKPKLPASWTSTDIVQAAVMAPAIVRLDLVRWRWNRFMLGLLHGQFGLAYSGRAGFGLGILGLGGHWPRTADGSKEYGFMFWPLSAAITDDLYVSYLNTQIFHRWNYDGYFVEAGAWISPVWFGTDCSGCDPNFYPIEHPGLSAYVGIGL
jgi:hypothetical protein